MKVLKIIIGLTVFLQVSSAFAMRGACGDRPLPSDKIRKIRDIRLECSSGVDHYFRRPVSMSKDKMTAYKVAQTQNNRSKMQEIRKHDIEWAGVVPYQTIEKWTWVEWVYGADPVCGYDRVCTSSTDSKGNRTEHCTDVMRSCWHDETRYEARHCTNEKIDYTARFERDQSWNPSNPNYLDILPNKFDLMPGESESVQVYSNSSDSETVNPFVEVGDAWNKYSTAARFTNISGRVQCRMNQELKVHATVSTIERKIRKTPNAFTTPVDEFGKPISAVVWTGGLSTDKQMIAEAEPYELRLTDSSSAMVGLLAEQSRKFTAEYEKAKNQAGLGTNASDKEVRDAKEQSQNFNPFWKNTKVRVRLFEKRFLLRDVRVTRNLEMSESDMFTNFGDQFRISLTSSDFKNDLYRASGSILGFNLDSITQHLEVKLKPEQEYYFAISMYQTGIPFYAADCDSLEEFRERLGCKWGDSGVYSKELMLDFSTPENYDSRSFLIKFMNLQGNPWWKKWQW